MCAFRSNLTLRAVYIIFLVDVYSRMQVEHVVVGHCPLFIHVLIEGEFIVENFIFDLCSRLPFWITHVAVML